MIRDRMPFVVDLALKYCKAKDKWIDHVYENFVSKYPKEKRSIIIKVLLGLRQQVTRWEVYDYYKYIKLMHVNRSQMSLIPNDEFYMPFKDTINWQNLDSNSYEYWKQVVAWVDWFKTSYAAIQNSYEHSCAFNNTEEDTIQILKDKYGLDTNLVNYLIKSFK